MSLKFLNKKTWHVATIQNQRRVFEAEEAAEAFKKRELERAKEVAQEREREEHRRMISAHKNAWEDDKGQVTNKGGALSFMYEPPPGLVSQIGDDGAHGGGGRTGGQSVCDDGRDGDKDMEQGSGFNPNTINPLGLEIRNVRCIKCKAWGHQMGDDECPLRNKSVEAELFRQQIEDPVMLFMDRSAGSKVTDRLVLRHGVDGRHGGMGTRDDLQQILLSDDEEKSEETTRLSKAQRKAIKRRLKDLKKLKKAEHMKKSKKERRVDKKDSCISSRSSSSDSKDIEKEQSRTNDRQAGDSVTDGSTKEHARSKARDISCERAGRDRGHGRGRDEIHWHEKDMQGGRIDADRLSRESEKCHTDRDRQRGIVRPKSISISRDADRQRPQARSRSRGRDTCRYEDMQREDSRRESRDRKTRSPE